MDLSPLTVVAYLVVGAFCAAWFWRVIRTAGRPANFALILVSGVFGALWPVMVPGVTVYRWMLPRPADFREDAATPVSH
ncbi:hypothetical protein V4U86_18770 [Mycobacterium sp. AMU20-3851]|jgi:hypothetical protein|uniref:hypothetical protein n=1 Tax=Mycobacterium sp. AMU20-3851 TaxID=3122055 RepID=UPI0037542CC4